MNKHIVTMTWNEGIIDQLVTVINLETEDIIMTYPVTIDDYEDEIIKICKMFNTHFISCREDLFSSEFLLNELILIKDGEVIPYEEENE